MKINEKFISHESNGETIIIDATGSVFSGFLRSNATAAFIVKCLAEETTEDQIAEKMLSYFEGATEKDVKEDITMVISKLRSVGALDD